MSFGTCAPAASFRKAPFHDAHNDTLLDEWKLDKEGYIVTVQGEL